MYTESYILLVSEPSLQTDRLQWLQLLPFEHH